MKVDNEESVVNIRSLQKSPQDKPVTKKPPENTGSEGDQVQLSAKAKEFQRIKDVLDKIPDARDEKVAQVRDSIDKGTYKADTKKTSENLIQESLIDLLV